MTPMIFVGRDRVPSLEILGHLHPNRSEGDMSLNLTFSVQGHTASGWESLGYTCLRWPPWGGLWDNFCVLNHSFIVQVGVPCASFSHTPTENRDAGCLIHVSIRVHPGWWVGYLKLLPLG